MAIDFSALVLRPAMTAFRHDATVTPTKSQPGQPAYPARGVFSNRTIEVATEQGYVTSREPVLGIRLDEFAVPPVQDDRVALAGVSYLVHDVHPDGQGGADLILKRA